MAEEREVRADERLDPVRRSSRRHHGRLLREDTRLTSEDDSAKEEAVPGDRAHCSPGCCPDTGGRDCGCGRDVDR